MPDVHQKFVKIEMFLQNILNSINGQIINVSLEFFQTALLSTQRNFMWDLCVLMKGEDVGFRFLL